MLGLLFTLFAVIPACGSSTGPEIPEDIDAPDEPTPPGGDNDDS